MASGAGSNYVLRYLLQGVNAAGITAVTATPPAAPAAYGTIGVNDSGGVAAEGRNYSKQTFTLIPVGSTALTNVQVAIYGTNSPDADQTFWNALQGPGSHYNGGTRVYGGSTAVPIQPQGFTDAAGYYPGFPSAAWVLLPSPSEQSGTGPVANPLTPQAPLLVCSTPWQSVRAVVVSATNGTGIFNVAVEWIP